jgi:hypothetical protein
MAFTPASILRTTFLSNPRNHAVGPRVGGVYMKIGTMSAASESTALTLAGRPGLCA